MQVAVTKYLETWPLPKMTLFIILKLRRASKLFYFVLRKHSVPFHSLEGEVRMCGILLGSS